MGNHILEVPDSSVYDFSALPPAVADERDIAVTPIRNLEGTSGRTLLNAVELSRDDWRAIIDVLQAKARSTCGSTRTAWSGSSTSTRPIRR